MAGRLQIQLPVLHRGRKSAETQIRVDREWAKFCAAIMTIRSGLEFAPSARGWCYVLEEYGLRKGKFDLVERYISDLRKRGDLPLDITAIDDSRETLFLPEIDLETPEEYDSQIEHLVPGFIERYTPEDLWEHLDVYCEMVVEKIDLKSLFAPICERYHVPLTNMRGWSDLHARAALMRRMQRGEAKGKRLVLLVCTDHDVGGLQIATHYMNNLKEMERSVDWDPSGIEVIRFGLTKQFINRHRLTWIDGLETSSGKRLDDPEHPQHRSPPVQNYLREHGPRKVEANALIVRPEAGRRLCQDAIGRYVSNADLDSYSRRLERARRLARRALPGALRRFATSLARRRR